VDSKTSRLASILFGKILELLMSSASMTGLDERLVSDEFLDDPYPLLRQLRHEEPVFWSESIGGWILTRYDDIVPTFRDVAHFSNYGRFAKVVEYLPAERRKKFEPFETHYRQKSMLQSDPPDHTRLRALIVKVFNANSIEEMRPKIKKIVNDVIDAVEPRRQMDVIRDLAFPLPFSVLGKIMGLPNTDQDNVKLWADEILLFQGVNRPPEAILERSQAALLAMRSYLTDLVNEKRRKPGEDLISELVKVEAEGIRLTEQELVYTCITMLGAGHETTTSLIGNGLFTLLSHPEEWRKLRENPSLLNSAIEEMLRYESPVARQPRVIKEDIELGGKKMLGGQVAFQMLNAANRDPDYFPDPDKFDIERQNNKHVAFGMGIHFCVGAGLARTEGQEVFKAIMERLPDIRLVSDKPIWDRHKPNSRMLHTLQVTF
jgi:pimeloyl-[acyl-carrier protein] synthase